MRLLFVSLKRGGGLSSDRSHHCFPILIACSQYLLYQLNKTAMILPEHIRRSLADQNTRTLKFLSEADAQVVSGISQLEWDKKTRNGVCAVWYGTNLRLPNLAQARLLTDLPREYEVAYDGLQSLAPSLDSKFSLAWQERNRILAGNHHTLGVSQQLRSPELSPVITDLHTDLSHTKRMERWYLPGWI